MAELTLRHHCAAFAMITRLERIAASGVLSEAEELHVRLLIVHACAAFRLATVAERPTRHSGAASFNGNGRSKQGGSNG